MKLKYLHADGHGKVYSGINPQELAAKTFCVRVFGELERPLKIGEQINPNTGAIEPSPKTPAQMAFEADKRRVKEIRALQAGTGLENTERLEFVDILIRNAHRIQLADD